MRKKLDSNTKRNCYIGIKVKIETRDKLYYIAEREGLPISTLVDHLIKKYIDLYFDIAKINSEYFYIPKINIE